MAVRRERMETWTKAGGPHGKGRECIVTPTLPKSKAAVNKGITTLGGSMDPKTNRNNA